MSADMTNKFRFWRHDLNVIIDPILMIIRDSDRVRATDMLVVQAIYEIIDDVREHGALRLVAEYEGESRFVNLYYDDHLVFSMKQKSSDIVVKYRRNQQVSWLTELLELAEAHAEWI